MPHTRDFLPRRLRYVSTTPDTIIVELRAHAASFAGMLAAARLGCRRLADAASRGMPFIARARRRRRARDEPRPGTFDARTREKAFAQHAGDASQPRKHILIFLKKSDFGLICRPTDTQSRAMISSYALDGKPTVEYIHATMPSRYAHIFRHFATAAPARALRHAAADDFSKTPAFRAATAYFDIRRAALADATGPFAHIIYFPAARRSRLSQPWLSPRAMLPPLFIIHDAAGLR